MKMKLSIAICAILFLAGCGSTSEVKTETEKALDTLNPAAQL